MALKDLLNKLVGGLSPPPPPDELTREAGRLVAALEEESREPGRNWQMEPAEYPSGKAILEGTPELQARALPILLERLMEASDGRDYLRRHVLKRVASSLLRRNLPYGERELVLLVDGVTRASESVAWQLPLPVLVGAIERIAGGGKPGDALAGAIRKLDDFLAGLRTAEHRKLRKRLAHLLAGPDVVIEIRDGGLWMRSVLADLDGASAEEKEAWTRLFHHGADVDGSAPSRKWLDRASELIAAIGDERFRARAAAWIERGPIPGAPTRVQATERDAAYLRSLVWAATTARDSAVTRAIGELADACFKKVPQFGAVSNKVGNACVWALGRLDPSDAVVHLSRLKARVKYSTAQRLIGKALDEAASRAGMTPADLEEASLPTYGMDPDGVLRRPFGEWQAEIAVRGERAELSWVKGSKRAKTTPAEVKRTHAEEAKALQKLAKEINATLLAQRLRLERLETWRRSWDVATWRDRYLAHPLLHALTGTLVWELSKGERTLLVQDGKDVEGKVIALDDWERVRLFHPLGADEATLRAWRAKGLAQPFKQLDRETFVPTDEERGGSTCTRFAGRTLKQHQLQALCRERGWRYLLQGGFDSWNQPTLELDDPRLLVLWDVEAVDDPSEMSDAAIYLYVRTGPLAFERVEGASRASVPLADVPPLVLSEILRDVDLFVASAAVS